MRIPCPHCHAEHCREALPACRIRAEGWRRLVARANGFPDTPGEAQARAVEEAVMRATAPLRQENALLRAEVTTLRALVSEHRERARILGDSVAQLSRMCEDLRADRDALRAGLTVPGRRAVP